MSAFGTQLFSSQIVERRYRVGSDRSVSRPRSAFAKPDIDERSVRFALPDRQHSAEPVSALTHDLYAEAVVTSLAHAPPVVLDSQM